jgi:lysine-arginine-ornithine-binding protein
MNEMKRIVVALGLALLAGAASAADLRIGSSADYPPWESVDATGAIVGFDRDVGDAVCKKIEATCTWINQGFDGLLPSLAIGKFDLVISGMSINAERAQQVDFSVAYADAPNAVAVAAGSKIAAAKTAAELAAALKGATVGVQTGTTHEQVVRAHFEGADVRTYDRPDQIADDLVAGRLDAGLMERSAWDPLVQERGADKIVYAGPLLSGADFSEFGQGQGIAMVKGNAELKGKIDAAVSGMLKSGEIKTLSEKWFGYDVSAR